MNISDKHLETELKKEFQLERMILFSDAVFAIAITLLAIEIKVPEIPKNIVTDSLLLHELDHLIPKFVGFFISFFIIGLYWTIHHRMFGYVINYTRRTLWLNLWFLFAVALMPFSTGLYSEYMLRLLKTPMIFYICNVCLLGIMNILLWKHLSDPKLGLTKGIDPVDARFFGVRAVVVPIVFVIALGVYFIQPKIALYMPLCIPIITRLIRKFFPKQAEKSGNPVTETNSQPA